MTQEDTNSEDARYEIDGEWLKQRLENLEAGFSKITEALSKTSEERSSSNEPKKEELTTPSEIQVTQTKAALEGNEQSQQTRRPRSRLVIRGPKVLRR